jgi:hypothetical protein
LAAEFGLKGEFGCLPVACVDFQVGFRKSIHWV